MRILKLPLSLPDFFSAVQSRSGEMMLRVPTTDILLHSSKDSSLVYGLSLLKQAIQIYESEKNIASEESKKNLDLFRESQLRLVGTEMVPFISSFYEGDAPSLEAPYVVISIDYNQLAEYCLDKSIPLIRCKYEDKVNIKTLHEQLDIEYDKVFYENGNIGFARGSQFVPLIQKAIIEMRPETFAHQQEWRVILFKKEEEINYTNILGSIDTDVPFMIPCNCITKVDLLPDFKRYPYYYTILIGWMKKAGLNPDRLLSSLAEV